MQLKTPGGHILTYYILQIFPFTSESKRMGIIVRVIWWQAVGFHFSKAVLTACLFWYFLIETWSFKEHISQDFQMESLHLTRQAIVWNSGWPDVAESLVKDRLLPHMETC